MGIGADGRRSRALGITGLVAAPLTPFRADGSVDPDAIARQAASLAQNGVVGAFVCGTTGEGLSLSVEERMAVAERWRAVSPPSLKIIVHVGHTCLADARKLAAHAEAIGAHAIASMAPCFFRPTGVQALVDYCAAVASAAPDTPFYYYHIPSMTGVDLPVSAFLEAADIPTLAGVKFTHNDLVELNRCLQRYGQTYDLLFGRDEMLLAALSLGVKGAVGSTYNFAAPVYQRILAAFSAGDLATARAEQAAAAEMIAAFAPYGGIPAQKAIMHMIGIPCGDVRLPLKPLAPAAFEALRASLEELGFFEHCASR